MEAAWLLLRVLAGLWFSATLLRPGAEAEVVAVDGRRAVAATGEDFVCATLDWWPPEKCDYGTCAWGRASLLNLVRDDDAHLDLSNKVLLNAVRAFAPLTLRLGGSLQDKVVYGTADLRRPCTPFVKNASEMHGFTQGCLPMRRWDELNDFFRKSGAKIVFGLNALNGRVLLPDGSQGGPWDYTNAASLIRYTVNQGYRIHGWELGNELSGSGVGTRVGVNQYAADVVALRSLIDRIYEGNPSKPLVIAPGGVDTHLVEKILNPSYLDGMASTFSNLQGILNSAGTSTVAWVGEAGGAYNSGHHLVTDSFVFSFWFLDQLGMSAKYDTKSYCRQSLIGGNYGLLNTTTFQPNPDYYSALLWHRLMGTKVLATTFSGSNKIRAYAHCARNSPGITLLLINLSGNTTTHVSVTSAATTHKQGVKKHSRKTKHVHVPGGFTGFAEAAGSMRNEYHLTPKDGNLQSQIMLLNGRALATDADGNIPRFEAVKVDAARPITVAPYSIVFSHIPHFSAPACS
ncbi:hypothetical protein PR202_ga17976 [Eleusine coracana subsp. coracana]|uniref:Heparanase-like protein 3 n=1 Tax=Eleusine coracana subsp. coracana TaxID=191504 RepID=A0AAV5CRS4_ELECO|nr:hypothetical protein PR202_ga17976 [Eleusine coracana subsp. coracana]